jgi:hypothetical protein
VAGETVSTGINWGQIGANVVNNLVNAGVNIGTSALSALVANQLAPHVEKERQQQAAAPAAPAAPVQTQAIVQQAPAASWQKYAPYAIGGVVILGVAYFVLGKRSRA